MTNSTPHETTRARSPLTRDELRDVIDLALWAGQILLQHGAEAERVEETLLYFAVGLGCDWVDVLVSPNVILLTTSSGEEFRTKVRRVPILGVDMTKVSAINRLSRRVAAGELDRATVRSELVRISSLKPHYNRWLVAAMVGLACAAFSRLFGADWPAFAVTWTAAAAAMVVRQELNRRELNPLLVTIVTAFTAGLVASAGALLKLSATPQLSLAASVLLLVPGVPLINAAEDLMKGHMVIGVVRGVYGILISLCIALGLLLAMRLTGATGL